MSLMNQLIIAPILLPLVTAALMLLLGEKRRPLKGRLNLLSALIGLGIAIVLLTWVRGQGQAESIGVYLPGNWPAPFGIVLVVDHLSALLLTLTGIIGVSAHAGVADRDRALAAGMDAFLVKPVALDALWTAVAGVSTAPAAPAAGFELPAPLRDRLRAEFARELPAQRASLAAAVQAGDWSAVYARAHYLRNSALVVQASDLFTACTALEAAAAGQNAPLVRDCWARCRALIDPLVPNVPGRA